MKDPKANDDSMLLPGDSPAARRLRRAVVSAAGCRLPVLVHGESGSGKEGVARAVHAWGPGRRGSLVAVNCAALSESLLEAELFGAVRGAYTGCDRDRPGLLREAHEGTLLLDEVGEMSPGLQGKLLRFLDDGTVRPVGGIGQTKCDVRIVAATHRDLRPARQKGGFRNDLWWRLAVVRIEVPPLRRRLPDLPAIVAVLAPRLEAECRRGPLELTAGAWQRLAEHRWPGNVRELRGVLARALLAANELPLSSGALLFDGSDPKREEINGLEERMIREALDAAGGHVARTAARIGWSRQKLYRRMHALGIRTAQSTRRDFDSTTSSASSTFQ